MKDKFAQKTLAALLSISNMGMPLPTREEVQKFKQIKDTTLQEAVVYFGRQHMETDEHEKMFLTEAKGFSKELRSMEMVDVRKTWPDVFDLFAEINSDAVFSGKIKEPKEPSKVPAMLARLNAIRVNGGKTIIAKWKASTLSLEKALRQEQEERYAQLKALLESKIVYPGMTKKQIAARNAELEKEAEKLRAELGVKEVIARITTPAPTVVAKGAYRSQEEAMAKTGHTTNGKTKTQAKYEAKKAKMVDKAVAAKSAPPKAAPKSKTSPTKKRDIAAGEISLAQIGETMKKTAKAVRAMARKHKKELTRLELRKYVYSSKDKLKIITVLGS